MNVKKESTGRDVDPVESDNVVAEEAGVAADVSEADRLRAELAEQKDRNLRLLAEFENYKKRTAREYAELMQKANDRIIVQTLDVVDNFERALDMTKQQLEDESCDDEKLFASLHEGARMIHQQLADLLKQHGVEEIVAEGEPFDPELHEATLQIPTNDQPEDRVVQVISKGYHKDGRVLRHARVGVSKPPDQAEAGTNKE